MSQSYAARASLISNLSRFSVKVVSDLDLPGKTPKPTFTTRDLLVVALYRNDAG
ncbi:MAG: hypothetical protein O3A00_23545 [Planctomycetota bacterium]|nr:hypothetical protein [Planctomycetota bacterium]